MFLYVKAKISEQQFAKQMGVRMVQAYNFQQSSKNILEAKTFLVIRAAQRVAQKLGNRLSSREFRQALETEFNFSHIKYQKKSPFGDYPNQISSPQMATEFICMDSLFVQLKFDEEITEQDCHQLNSLLNESNIPIGLVMSYSPRGLNINRIIKKGK